MVSLLCPIPSAVSPRLQTLPILLLLLCDLQQRLFLDVSVQGFHIWKVKLRKSRGLCHYTRAINMTFIGIKNINKRQAQITYKAQVFTGHYYLFL